MITDIINKFLKKNYNMEYSVFNQRLIIFEPITVKELEKIKAYIKVNKLKIKEIRVDGEWWINILIKR